MNEVHTSQFNTSRGWATLRFGDLSADQGRLLSKRRYIKSKDQLTLFLGFAMIRPAGCSWGSVMKKYRLDGIYARIRGPLIILCSGHTGLKNVFEASTSERNLKG